MKTCTKCKETKPLDAFHRRSAAKDGRQHTCKDCQRAATYKWREENPEKWKAARKTSYDRTGQHTQRLRLYGITEEQFAAMLAEQDGKCLLCDEEMTPPHVDHDHTTGKIRGLLCRDCNVGLGKFKDSPAALRRAADYIESTRRNP